MTPRYSAPSSLDAALAAVAAAGARPLGGGTDLIVAMEVGLDAGASVVDLTRVRGLAGIETMPDGGVRIGGAVRLEDVALHDTIRDRYPALAQAAAAVGTPALRAMGTIGGNLGQRPRCWYLRSRIPCLKNGHAGCPARDGENQYHAIFETGPCRAAHPSDTAVALLALDASVVARHASGTRRLSVAELYAPAATDAEHEMALGRREIIEAVELPASAAGGMQRFTKVMQRGAWDFATVSLAATRRGDGTVRLVLGGVAAAPWRVNPSVEEDVASGALDPESADALAARALYDAEPLSQNAYKVDQATALLRRAMVELSRA
ncbi:MAG TPA: FAD binding domain-containing protein [Gemmatimonadaceae bacterium]|nr:FAD binding domain-containing protein [Gemmatimonadaceae bacterium]